jgi:hypothetical protein
MQGEAITFADADLQAIADAYDPAISQAPIVVGHPAIDAPAYGWIDSLAVDGDRLAAVPEQVDPAFADLVRAGRFKTVSASFYRPGQTNNPRPEGYYLRHVGFLGAQPPAVKGLKPASFADDPECLTVEFADWQGSWATASGFRAIGRLFRSLRDYLIASDGLDAADKVLPDWDVTRVAEIPAELDPPPGTSPIAYSDPPENEDQSMPTPAELEAREAELQQRQSAIEAREARFAEDEATRRAEEVTRRTSEDAVLLDSLVAAGRLPKDARPLAEALFAEMRAGDETIDFADGESTKKVSARNLLGRLLEALPLPVPTGELAFGEAGIDGQDPQAIGAAIKAAAEKNGGDVLKGLAAIRGSTR